MVPGQPLAPEIILITRNSVNLKWKEPTYNGGNAVFGYFIEQKDLNSILWTRSHKNPIKELSLTAKGTLF